MKMSDLSKARLKRAVIIAYPSILITLLILVLIYSKYEFNIGVVCPFNEILGWECPGCGGTRMAVSLLHLEFYQAFRYNPFVFITLPILGIVYTWQTIKFIFQNQTSVWLDKFLIIYAILLITYGVIRNIGIFSWLQPTVI